MLKICNKQEKDCEAGHVCDTFSQKCEQDEQRHFFSLSNACLLTQASRLFDEEGRKKFFTLDMNNILLE